MKTNDDYEMMEAKLKNNAVRDEMEARLQDLASLSLPGSNETIQSVTITRGARGSFRLTARLVRTLYIEPSY